MVAAHIMSQTMVMIPATLILSLMALLPLYYFVGYAWSVFVPIWLAHTATILFAECLAQLMSVCFSDFLFGMVGYIGIMFVAFLQAGMVISIDSIPVMLRWISYINPW